MKIKDINVNNIPKAQLDKYTKNELRYISRFAMQALDIILLKMRWQLLEENTNKGELIRIISRINQWGTLSVGDKVNIEVTR
jgi:hypothetical protein